LRNFSFAAPFLLVTHNKQKQSKALNKSVESSETFKRKFVLGTRRRRRNNTKEKKNPLTMNEKVHHFD